ncbi:MAG: deoxyribonuclease IV [Acidobacteriaceae bacterium]|nr:deoxyribonuclease IV [Acidobacteriaceae bacterium]
MRIGIHTSTSGSLEKAALKAAELGANTFQIFSASPRMWRAGTPDPVQVHLLRRAREKHDLFPLVIHDSYLINLASCDEELRTKSVAAFRGEIQRALTIGAEFLVAHPGNCRGQSVEQGIAAVVRSLVEACRDIDTMGLTVLLENTAGAGASLGSHTAELKMMRDYAVQFCDLQIGFCVDTCHCFVSGYDTIAFAAELGMEHVRVIHANDSKGAFESHLDRHANIGEGQIGVENFRRILSDPRVRHKAFILETPVDEPGDDLKNVSKLKSLCPKERPAKKKK